MKNGMKFTRHARYENRIHYRNRITEEIEAEMTMGTKNSASQADPQWKASLASPAECGKQPGLEAQELDHSPKVSEKFKLQRIMTGKWGSCGTPWKDLTSELRTWNKEKR